LEMPLSSSRDTYFQLEMPLSSSRDTYASFLIEPIIFLIIKLQQRSV
jgi:hypothetical protein